MPWLEKTFARYQRCKEITRLQKKRGMSRLFAGAWAAGMGRRLFRHYRTCRPELPDPLPGGDGPVVSLTSFPPRMQHLWMVVDTLIRMRPAPSEIVLTLFEGDFPDRRVPESLEPYLSRGLSILWAPENLKPHLKYRYTFERERDGKHRPVVTVDDDLFYAPDTLGRLLALHQSYPEAVCANQTKRMVRREDGSWAPYAEWPLQTAPSGPGQDLLALGFGGVLYPFSVYSRPVFYETEQAVRLALKADDLWLRRCETAEGIGVVTGSFLAVAPEIPSTQAFSYPFPYSLTANNHIAVNAK